MHIRSRLPKVGEGLGSRIFDPSMDRCVDRSIKLWPTRFPTPRLHPLATHSPESFSTAMAKLTPLYPLPNFDLPPLSGRTWSTSKRCCCEISLDFWPSGTKRVTWAAGRIERTGGPSQRLPKHSLYCLLVFLSRTTLLDEEKKAPSVLHRCMLKV